MVVKAESGAPSTRATLNVCLRHRHCILISAASPIGSGIGTAPRRDAEGVRVPHAGVGSPPSGPSTAPIVAAAAVARSDGRSRLVRTGLGDLGRDARAPVAP